MKAPAKICPTCHQHYFPKPVGRPPVMRECERCGMVGKTGDIHRHKCKFSHDAFDTLGKVKRA